MELSFVLASAISGKPSLLKSATSTLPGSFPVMKVLILNSGLLLFTEFSQPDMISIIALADIANSLIKVDFLFIKARVASLLYLQNFIPAVLIC